MRRAEGVESLVENEPGTLGIERPPGIPNGGSSGSRFSAATGVYLDLRIRLGLGAVARVLRRGSGSDRGTVGALWSFGSGTASPRSHALRASPLERDGLDQDWLHGDRRCSDLGLGLTATRGAGGSGSACPPPAPPSGSSACRVTLVPHPEGSIETVPLPCSPSQATVCSGSSLVIVISPKAPKCFARPSTSLSSSQSSGGDFTRVRSLSDPHCPGFD